MLANSLGRRSAIVGVKGGRDVPSKMMGELDRALLDPQYSGSSVISKDLSVKASKVCILREMLLAADGSELWTTEKDM